MTLEIKTLPANPMILFDRWFKEAQVKSKMHFPNAMALATADKKGRPSVRQVLLKGSDKQGFYFFTNYESRKGVQLAQNPHAALCFFWDKTHKQIRV